MYLRPFLPALLPALLLAVSCSKAPDKKMVNTWTLKDVRSDGSTMARINAAVHSLNLPENSADSMSRAMIKNVENNHAGTVYTLKDDGTCTVKSASGELQATWEFGKTSENNAVFIRQGNDVLETWTIYDEDIKLAHDCACLPVRITVQDPVLKQADGDAMTTLDASLYPASMDGLDQY